MKQISSIITHLCLSALYIGLNIRFLELTNKPISDSSVSIVYGILLLVFSVSILVTFIDEARSGYNVRLLLLKDTLILIVYLFTSAVLLINPSKVKLLLICIVPYLASLVVLHFLMYPDAIETYINKGCVVTYTRAYKYLQNDILKGITLLVILVHLFTRNEYDASFMVLTYILLYYMLLLFIVLSFSRYWIVFKDYGTIYIRCTLVFLTYSILANHGIDTTFTNVIYYLQILILSMEGVVHFSVFISLTFGFLFCCEERGPSLLSKKVETYDSITTV